MRAYTLAVPVHILDLRLTELNPVVRTGAELGRAAYEFTSQTSEG